MILLKEFVGLIGVALLLLKKDQWWADTSGKLPFQRVRWVGGGTAKEKAGRELRKEEGAVEVEEKKFMRSGLKGWQAEIGKGIESNFFRLFPDE